MSQHDHTQPPAWRGGHSHPGVTVPADFEQVAGLGPAIHVTEHQGIRLLPSFGPPRVNIMVRYHDGLAYRTSGQEVHTLLWPEVAVITSNITTHTNQNRGGFATTHYDREYTLTKNNGDQLILDDGLKDVGEEAWEIKQVVFPLLRPPALQRYKSGEALTFGPVTIEQPTGLQLEGKLYAWDAIQNVQISGGQLKVTLSTGKHHEARVSAIPNVELLCQIIGVHFDPKELAYEAFI